MKVMVWWYRFRLRTTDVRFANRVGEAAREIAILWLVFSLLDKFVAERMSVEWALGNIIVCIALWLLGIYIEGLLEGRR